MKFADFRFSTDTGSFVFMDYSDACFTCFHLSYFH